MVLWTKSEKIGRAMTLLSPSGDYPLKHLPAIKPAVEDANLATKK